MSKTDIFNELSEHISINIHSCSDAFHDDKWIESKAHVDYDIWLVLAGNVYIDICDSTYSARAGDVILFYPDSPYTAHTDHNGCSFIFTHFNLSIGNNSRVLNDFNMSGIIPKELIQEEALMYKKWFFMHKDKAPASALVLKGYFTGLLAKVLHLNESGKHKQAFFNHNSNIIYKRKGKRQNNIFHLQPVLQYITDNIDKSIKIGELANIAGMSNKYFIKHFKESLGIPPGRYVNQVKMNRAKDYLYLRRFTIKEISNMLGYPDPASFTKAFKKHYAVPPSKFLD